MNVFLRDKQMMIRLYAFFVMDSTMEKCSKSCICMKAAYSRTSTVCICVYVNASLPAGEKLAGISFFDIVPVRALALNTARSKLLSEVGIGWMLAPERTSRCCNRNECLLPGKGP